MIKKQKKFKKLQKWAKQFKPLMYHAIAEALKLYANMHR